jgi:hypothetical protein
MRSFFQWFVVAFVLTSTAAMATLPKQPPLAVYVDDVPTRSFGAMVIPLAPVVDTPTFVSRRDWCEPVDPMPCLPKSACPATHDGTARSCVREWWVSGSTRHVCIATEPTEATQLWRAARLRVLVDEICTLDNGCDPVQLHAYLSVLAQRESSWRPYAVHRLGADRRANTRAWAKLSTSYLDSPAYDEPRRWSVGLGYFGANPTYHLARWDATAEPETLCGEVEGALVHLRVARDRWRRLSNGVACDGGEHFGTDRDGQSSWYDISQSNSGSNACPGESGRALELRRGFEHRAETAKLDPYGPVSLTMLGRDVSTSTQDEFAAMIRERMDRLHPRS